MTTASSIKESPQTLLDNDCNPSALDTLELAIAWEMLENERVKRKEKTEPMQYSID